MTGIKVKSLILGQTQGLLKILLGFRITVTVPSGYWYCT